MNKALPLFSLFATIIIFVNLQYTALAQTFSFTTAGLHTFSVPSGVTTIQAEAWGGGGKGGSKTSGSSTYGGGGGGAYARKDHSGCKWYYLQFIGWSWKQQCYVTGRRFVGY